MKGQKKSFMIKKESGTKFHKSFFMAMKHVPTSTAQEKKFNTKTGAVYLDERAAKAKKTLDDALSKFDKLIPIKFDVPSQKELNLARSLDTTVETKVHRGLQGAVKLKTIWCFPEGDNIEQKDGKPKTTKPDTDNLIKQLKDVMANRGWFNKGDQQVVDEQTIKIHSKTTGIFVDISEI